MAHADLRVQVRNATLEPAIVQHALIVWDDENTGQLQHLGRVFASDDDRKAKLTLWLGFDRSTRQTLISFHLPLVTRPARTRNAKHTYVVIPIDRANTVTDQIPINRIPYATIWQLGKDKAGSSDTIFRARFTLKDPVYVVMPIPTRPLEGPLKGAPSQLVTLLKSLSETLELDVYLENTSEVLRTSWKWEDATTPEVNLNAIYGRGCTGGKNIWDQYPCDDSNSDATSWNPFVDDGPPPYEEVVRKSVSPKNFQAINPIHSPLALTKFREFGSPVSPSVTSSRLTWGATPERGPHVQFKDCPPQLPEKELSPIAVLPPSPHPQPREEKFSPMGALSRRGQKRNFDEANLETNCNSPTVLSPLVLGSPTQRDSTASSPKSMELSSLQPMDFQAMLCEATAIESAVSSFLSHSPAGLNKTEHLLEIKEWLQSAWRYHPLVHETYRAQFLRLGQCTREYKAIEFDVTMMELQRKVITDRGTRESVKMPSPIPHDYEEQVEYIRAWLTANICRKAVTMMLGLLINLQDLASHAKREGRSAAVDSFHESKAMCFAIAFYAFGGRV